MEYAKKKFGQNFISDKNLINKIINLLDPEPDHLVIEVGPGRGALTKELCNRFKKVIAIEIDKDMESILKSEITSDNFELLISDILEIDLKDLITQNKNYKKISFISNTPYYITSEIIFKVFESYDLLDKAVYMVQKEVATRICANVNENNYNNLSIAAKYYSKVKYEFTVKKQMFNPIPKVDSSIISFEFDDHYPNIVQKNTKFIAFVRILFNNKRKTILNNLGTYLNDKSKAKTILDKCLIKENLRPENISIEQYIAIFKEVDIND